MIKQYYSMNRIDPYGNESKRKKVKGRRVNLKMFPKFIFFYYKGILGYCIYEFSSGFATGYGDTLKEAKETAISNLKNVKIKKFRQMVKNALRKMAMQTIKQATILFFFCAGIIGWAVALLFFFLWP